MNSETGLLVSETDPIVSDTEILKSDEVTPKENNIMEIPILNQEVRFPGLSLDSHLKLPISYYFQMHSSLNLPVKLRMTNISLYSTTPWKEANFISRAIANFYRKETYDLAQSRNEGFRSRNEGFSFRSVVDLEPNQMPENLPRPIIVTDATAHIGGNSISFHLNGFKVNAVEPDALAYDILQHNLSQYQMPVDTVYQADYLQIYRDLKQDVVFLDPPWGGPDYKKIPILDLYLGHTNLIDLCVNLMGGDSSDHIDTPKSKKIQLASLIVLKLPINYNLPALINKMPNRNFLTQKIYRGQNRHCYNVIFCW